MGWKRMRLPLIQKLNTDTLDVIDTVNNITSSYTSELDKCINEIQVLLSNEEDISPQQLNYYITILPILLYDITGKITELGIKSDAAKMQRRTVFNEAYLEQTQGTVSKKTSVAQNQSMNEQFVEDVMLRAYKECASKIEIATMLHSSLKKVQSWKTSELEITRNNILK
jgi:hypothetical protein